MKIIDKKKIIISIITSFLLIITISGGLLIWKSFGNKKEKLEEVVLRSGEFDSKMFAIMIGDTEGNYTESGENTLPQKEDGYIFNKNKSECIDSQGNNLGEVLSYRNNMIRLKVQDAAYCYLYFDIISEGDFCLDDAVQANKLSDCLLVSEDYYTDTEEAKQAITLKGSATTSQIAPTIKFAKKITSVTNESGVVSSTSFYLATGYTFNENSGRYTLKSPIADQLNDDYVNYYACASSSSCTTMYQVKAYKVSGSAQYITSADVYTYSSVDSFDSEVGLYKTTDADGDTYFYRGAVKNNYVSYGGFIWRVVRINGNGTVRMIYSGASTNATGAAASIGDSRFNTKYLDPTYVGYKYGEDLVKRETDVLATYYDIGSNTVYYYGAGYVQTSDGRFQLDQTKTIKSGKWSEVHEDVIANAPYTCLRNSATGICDVVLHLKEYVNANRAKAYYITNNSKDYASTLTNTTDSTIKGVIDTWYETNIKDKTDADGNQLSSYLSDEIFCNDRSIYSGTGYKTSTHTYYGAYNRVASKRTPSLLCTQNSDKFSVSNGNLTYPIALIMVDEVSLAGSVNGSVNTGYYLYTGDSYWTMSPYNFNASYIQASEYKVDSDGTISGYRVFASDGVRPVINLKSEVKISQGNGTASNPYVVTL